MWGVNIDTVSEKMSLPEARVLKGAYLLAEPQFNFGEENGHLQGNAEVSGHRYRMVGGGEGPQE